MPAETSYTNLRQNLASVLDQVSDNREVVIVRRRRQRDVALIPADELSSLMETAHLLRSPANAARLAAARLEGRAGRLKADTLPSLRREFGLDKG